MRTCLVCSAESDALTCPKCGEASWSAVHVALVPPSVMRSVEAEVTSMEAPRKKRRRKKARSDA